MHSDPPQNLVAVLEGLVPAEAECQTVEIRRRENAPVDARFFFKGKEWPSSPTGKEFLETLVLHPMIAEARMKGSMLSLRLSDAYIDSLGAGLERGEAPGLDTSMLLAGREFMVGFAGPNTSKALHIGHLRNISIGNALAAALRSAGAGVLRHSLVGDIGRNICEAMAGYTLYHDGEDPTTSAQKPDHFIGECYARFIREHSTKGATAGGDPIERELSNTNDAADRYMQAWLAAEPGARALWSRIREWVMEGHRRTLRRFGVAIERHDFESEAMADVPAIMAEGIQRGVLDREPDGTVVYRSGREEFETMILARDDGFPTEHARLLGVYFRLLDERAPGETYIDLAGTEWQPASSVHMELMAKIRPQHPNVGHVQLFHGMVTMKNAKMSSSEGDAVLIDDLLDRLAALSDVQNVAALSGGSVTPDEASDIIIKSFFLCRPHNKVMEYSWDLLIGNDNPGWTIARAWCHAMAGEESTAAAFDPNLYRLLVIRSQEYFRNLEAAALEFDLAGLTSYLLHYCEDYLKAPGHPRMKLLARTVLRRSLESLGLL